MIRQSPNGRMVNIFKGFTLIELIVVISIIGILIGLTVGSVASSQKQARNTQRKSDLKQYQTALENYANINGGFFLSKTTATNPSSFCTDLGSTSCPVDPQATVTNYYRYLSDGTGTGATATQYVLWAQLERSSTIYWVVCSDGKSVERTIAPTTGNCPI